MKNIQPGDVLYVATGSHYGPQTTEVKTVEWASDNGSDFRFTDGTRSDITRVSIKERATVAIQADSGYQQPNAQVTQWGPAGKSAEDFVREADATGANSFELAVRQHAEAELNALADAITDYVRAYAADSGDEIRRTEARLLTSKYLGEVVPA